MFTFKDHLQAPILVESKNQHLEHVEDNILKNGRAGAISALHIISSLADTLRGHSDKKINVTTKWDGSPALVVGINPENGKFFVGTKSVFNKGTKKIAYTNADIKKHYSKPELAEKLEAALKYLPSLGINGVLQGDLLFTTGDVKAKTIDGEEMITFQPNTIVYAIPATSNLADDVKKAKIGIVFHTKYSGNTMDSMRASYDVSVDGLKKSSDVWFKDATYSDTAGSTTLTIGESGHIETYIRSAEKALPKIKNIDQLLANKNLISMLKMFTNAQVRAGDQFGGNLKSFIIDRVEKEKTSDATKTRKKATYDELLKKHKSTIDGIVLFQYAITQAKLLLIDKLKAVESIGTFLPDGDGYKVTSPEGFVAIDHFGSAVKLVDRLEFSQANFQRNTKMKLNELNILGREFGKKEPKPIPQADPKQIDRIAALLKHIKAGPDYDDEDEAHGHIDTAVAPYDDIRRPKSGPLVSIGLSKVGLQGVLSRIQDKHYGKSRLDRLEKELSQIADRINIH